MLDMSSKGSAEFPQHLLDGLDMSVFEELCRSTDERRDHKLKYADLELWLRRAWKEATRLDLERSPPVDVLDIGMGPGYFLYFCRKLGHRVTGLDRPGFYPFWQGLRQWLGIHRVIEHTIKPKQKLPPELGRFDLVTAFRAQFNFNLNEKRLWNLDEWAFFLDDLRDNVLKPGGRLALKLAKQEHKGDGGLKRSDDSLTSFMTDRGAIQDQTLLIFAPLR
jgi:SAM-dependent methyltransferase